MFISKKELIQRIYILETDNEFILQQLDELNDKLKALTEKPATKKTTTKRKTTK
jgi:hypothetical protein